MLKMRSSVPSLCRTNMQPTFKDGPVMLGCFFLPNLYYLIFIFEKKRVNLVMFCGVQNKNISGNYHDYGLFHRLKISF